MINILLSLWTFGEPYLKDEMLKYIKPCSKVTLISFAQNGGCNSRDSYDEKYGLNGKHFVLPEQEFEKFGVRKENIQLVHYFDDSKAEMTSKIANADILMFTGGMPDKAMARLIEKDIIDDIRSFDKVIMGYSAGAIIQLKRNFLSPDEDYPELTYFNGLSYINNDFYIEVHYDGKDGNWEKLLQEISLKENKTIYAMGNYGAAVVDENRNLKTFGDVTVFK